MDSGESARLFLALWPDAETRARLRTAQAQVAQVMAGQWARADNLHITLAFLGQIGRERWPLIAEVARSVSAPEFILTLDHAEFWPRNGIVCLAASQPPRPLLDLAEDLARRLSAAGFSLDSRPYRAHLTLARKGRSAQWSLALSEPVSWRLDAFGLIESRPSREGSVYTVRQSWPLQDQPFSC